MHYYKRNLGDYAKKAGRLSILQHGVYNLLIDACYDREEFPTEQDAIDWVWASTDAEVEAVKFVLKRFFTFDNGTYVQNRIKEEIEQFKEKSDKNRQIAIEREETKKQSARNVKDNARFVQEREPNQEPLTTNHKPITNNQEPLPNNQVTNNQVVSIFSAKAEKICRAKPKNEIEEVFNYWREFLNHPNAKINAKRGKAIASAIKLGYTVAQIKQAIVGCSKSPFHMGANDTGDIYDDLPIIVRNIDKFIEKSERPQTAYGANRQTERIEYQPSPFAEILGTNFDAIDGVAL